MNIDIKRFSFGDDSTGGLLFIDGEFECYTVEDQVREFKIPQRSKVRGETAIPEGTYEVKFRTVGGFHQRYRNRYGEDFHKGMLEIQDVPNFKYILFHTGNHDDHTEGCILVGNTLQTAAGENMIPPGRTRVCYKEFYPKVRDALMDGKKVFVSISQYKP